MNDRPSVGPGAAGTLSSRERTLALAAISAAFLAVFWPALLAGFYVVEDHLLLPGPDAQLGLIARVMSDVHDFQRVRPLYWLYLAAGRVAFGAHPHLWHAVTLTWGIVTAQFLYVAMRRSGLGRLGAAAAIGLLVVGSSHTWAWIDLIPQETTGMAVTAIVVWALVRVAATERCRPWDVLALAGMAVAGLIKESFILVIPALMVLRVLSEVRLRGGLTTESRHRLRVPLTGALIVLAVELGIAAAAVVGTPAGYSATASGISLSSLSPEHLLSLVDSLDVQILIGSAIALWVFAWFDSLVSRWLLAATAALAVLWVVPQVLLYSHAFQERYLLPTMAGMAGLLSASLTYAFLRRRLWIVGVVALLALGSVLARGVTATTRSVSMFAADTRVVGRAVQFVAQNVSAAQAVLVATDSGTPYGFEAIHTVPSLLRVAGVQSPTYLWPLVSRGERSQAHLAASKNNTIFRYPDTLSPRDVGGIIVMDKWVPGLDVRPLNQWLDMGTWREIVFAEPYYAFSLGRIGYEQVGQSWQRVFVPGTALAAPAARALVVLDSRLAGSVSLRGLLETPPWGLEPDYAGSGSIVWLGPGDAEGFGVVLDAPAGASVDLACELVLGPALQTPTRTIELEVRNGGDVHVDRRTFTGADLRFHVDLKPGPSHLRLRVVDPMPEPDPSARGTRRALALLRRVTVELSH